MTEIITHINIIDVIERDVHLKRHSNTEGGEYAGPCPFCGTGDDRLRVWPNHSSGKGRFWCRQCDTSGDAIDYLRERDGLTYTEALETLSNISNPTPLPPRIAPSEAPAAAATRKAVHTQQEVARYTYENENHVPNIQVRRIHLLDEEGERIGKRFYQYHNNSGEWVAGLGNIERIPYRLPELKAALQQQKVIYFVEGEKCAHALADIGLNATTTLMGSSGWNRDYADFFDNAYVVILPDNDKPGQKFARTVAEDMIANARMVKVLNLPELDEGEDVADWLEAGNTRQDLEKLTRETQPWNGGFDLRKIDDDKRIPDLDDVLPEIPEGTGQWIDDYVDYAKQFAPTSPDNFHETAALWLIATVIARRTVFDANFGQVFPNIFVAWVARTTIWNKSTSLNIARDLIQEALPHLLMPEESTQEAMLSDMAGMRPTNYQNDNGELSQEIELWKKERDFAAQRSWMLDEMSGLLASAGKDYNGGMVEAIMRFYDCEKLYRRSTRGQGRVVIRNSYLNFIGCSTPAAMARYMMAPTLWANGFWPRFAIITPDQELPDYAKPTGGERNPDYLLKKLLELDAALPDQEFPNHAEPIEIQMTAAAERLWDRFNYVTRHSTLIDLLTGDEETDDKLLGSYGRLPTQAIKVATLIAMMDWDQESDPRIESRHMIRALHIVNEWRKSLHRLIDTLLKTKFEKLRVRILYQIGRGGIEGVSYRDIYKAMKDVSPFEVRRVLDEMEALEDVYKYRNQKPGGGRPTDKYLLIDQPLPPHEYGGPKPEEVKEPSTRPRMMEPPLPEEVQPDGEEEADDTPATAHTHKQDDTLPVQTSSRQRLRAKKQANDGQSS